MLSDWIATRLSGVLATEPSLRVQLGHVLAGRPDLVAGDRRDLRHRPLAILPPVTDPGTVIGAVTAAAAAETGLRAGTPVVAGGADTQLGLLGIGAQPRTSTPSSAAASGRTRSWSTSRSSTPRPGCGRSATSSPASG